MVYKALISGVVKNENGEKEVVLFERLLADDTTDIFDDVEHEIESYYKDYDGTDHYFLVGATAEYEESRGYDPVETDIVYGVIELSTPAETKDFIMRDFMFGKDEIQQFIEENQKKLGYIMHEASRRWVEKDPVGALTEGPAIGLIERYGTYYELLNKAERYEKTLQDIGSFETEELDAIELRDKAKRALERQHIPKESKGEA